MKDIKKKFKRGKDISCWGDNPISSWIEEKVLNRLESNEGLLKYDIEIIIKEIPSSNSSTSSLEKKK